MKNLFTVLTVIFALSISAQESVKLRLNYEKGATYTQNVETIMDAGMSLVTNKMKMKFKVVDIKDGVFITENEVKSLVADVEAQGQTIHYDLSMSEGKMGPMEKMIHEKVKGMKGAVFMIHYSNLGEFKEVKFKKGNFDTTQFKNSGIAFPKEELKVSSTWQNKKSLPQGIDLVTIYTVKKITKDTVVVSISGSISGVATGSINGEMIIDRTSGMAKSSKITQNMDVGGQQMTSKINTTITKE